MKGRIDMKIISKLTALIAAGAIALSQISFVGASAEETEYYAFGDSIPAGYGLSETETGFPELIAKKLGAKLTNYSVSGMTTDGFIEQISKMDGIYVDYITISIGSNNLLGPFQKIICETAGVSSAGELGDKISELYGEGGLAGLSNLSQLFTALNTALTDNAELNEACRKFAEEDMPKVIEAVSGKIDASEGKAFFTNIYNPYYGVDIQFLGTSYLNLGELADGYIQKMNAAIETATANNSFEVADVYTLMNKEGLTNVNISTANLAQSSFDPHPNAAGHAALADFITNTLCDRQVGDIYCDGKINLKDLVRIVKIVAQLETYEPSETVYLDCNVDGVVGIEDAALMIKYIAKFDVVLGTAA